ncbi:sulfotransferase [Microbulbifer sp. ZKSA002]|uniref:sulfotransferase n=1 Tax=Microbulbifer sp. ZKSA002 TaxID=3243388 RepID=UPI00403A0CB5
MLSPILVRAFGRTGTTLLMQLLKSSEDIFVPNDYPFESRFLTYFSRLSRLPLKDCGGEREFSYKDGDVLDSAQNLMGPMPYGFDGILDRERHQKRMLYALWNQFTQEIHETQKSKYKFYAEKVALDLAPYINNSLPAVNNIFVTRDPRGELASIVSFNKKRGFNGFGWREDDTLETFARRMIDSRRSYLKSVNKFRAGHNNIIVIRFEDLVANLQEVADQLSQFLNVKLDSMKVIADTDKYSFHMTSGSIQESQDKWKRELPNKVIQIFEEEMADALELFDYGVN